ncbi:MAG: pyridoxal phosphate-dependent aminotransferase family protein [Chthoniobacterales bacterium]
MRGDARPGPDSGFDASLSLGDFVVGPSDDLLKPPAGFTEWRQAGAWEAELYEPNMLASADVRTSIQYDGKAQPVINLCSYNYLGLANHPEVVEAATVALRKYGVGACGSPTLSGMTDVHRQLEQEMAKFLGRDDAILFNSGFGGALGTISGLLRKADVAVMDDRSHLSLRDGAVLSRCRIDRFEHNHAASLQDALIRRKGKRTLVIVEGIYSMDGDFASLDELLAVAEEHNATVMIDEAHSMLGCGEHGRGAAEHFHAEHRIPLIYGTFSKAFGALGGFIAGPQETMDYLRLYAHSYVYSCALPPSVVAAILKGLEISNREPELRTRLWDNADYFRTRVNELGIETGASTTYIMPLVIGDRSRMYRLGHELRRRGLWVAPVDYPAVPQDRICFRACVTANHSRADLDEALHILEETLVPELLQKA